MNDWQSKATMKPLGFRKGRPMVRTYELSNGTKVTITQTVVAAYHLFIDDEPLLDENGNQRMEVRAEVKAKWHFKDSDEERKP